MLRGLCRDFHWPPEAEQGISPEVYSQASPHLLWALPPAMESSGFCVDPGV